MDGPQGGASICVNNAINRVLGINSKQSILRFLIIIMYLQCVSIMVIAHVQCLHEIDFFKGFMALSGILLILSFYILCVKFAKPR